MDANDTAVQTPELLERFQARLLRAVHTNNVLRGAWAGEIAVYYLGDGRFPEHWSYFDVDWQGRKVAVKHSVGSAARFAIPRTPYTWESDSVTPGSRPIPGSGPNDRQYWCDLYLFAWLDLGQKVRTPPTLDQVLEPSQWRFAILSRVQMEARFDAEVRSVGRSVLAGHAPFVDGASLPTVASQPLGLA